ncbi:MAG: RNA recognition motif domain-containing protein [Planctomycetota bacterium]
MGKKLYVGNLGYDVNDADLSQLFAQHGTVESAVVITDKMTGQSKGFGFVEMSTDQEAQTAISELNGQDLDGRPMTVDEAKPRPAGGGRGGRGGRGGGGRHGGGRRY